MTAKELIDFELKVKEMWEGGKIKAPVHLCGGNEEELILIFRGVHNDDYVFCSHRNHYHYLLHNGDPSRLLNELRGSAEALCKGSARSMAFCDYSCRFFSSAIVGGVCAPAVGTAWALKDQKKPNKVWCFGGDGMVDTGHFWEALQYAEGWDLPVTFVIEDNDRSTCTPVNARIGPTTEYDYKPQWQLTARKHIECSSKVRYYKYKATYPHVGSGTYVQF